LRTLENATAGLCACTPWELARAWPGAELIIIEDSGHTGSTTMTGQMHAAADRLYEKITNPERGPR
jgi:proline iminopeptidase